MPLVLARAGRDPDIRQPAPVEFASSKAAISVTGGDRITPSRCASSISAITFVTRSGDWLSIGWSSSR
jgi:hypothetical protein